MVQRVLIQDGAAAGIQVSLPGFDVTTATLNQMAFDSRFANMHLVIQGVVFVSWETPTTVFFPQAFSTIPRLICGMGSTFGGEIPQGMIGTAHSPSAVLTSNAGTYLSLVLAQVTNSSMTFYSALFDKDNDPAVRSFASVYCWYSVYR